MIHNEYVNFLPYIAYIVLYWLFDRNIVGANAMGIRISTHQSRKKLFFPAFFIEKPGSGAEVAHAAHDQFFYETSMKTTYFS